MNRLVIAAAGSGKTTFIIEEALKITNQKVLITTYTEANEAEIRKKFIELNGFVPENINIQTWFSFLLQHGVKPYQNAIFDEDINGLLLVNQKSGLKFKRKFPVYYPEDEPRNHYFSKGMLIYSDKIAKFVCKADEAVDGLVIDRLSRIYPNIFIDEVQDLAGFDLEIVRIILKSNCNLVMVGDPRQVTYHTHEEAKYGKYCDGKIEQFIIEQCKGIHVEIDKASLNTTFRNEKSICDFANSIYSEYIPCHAAEKKPTGHDGIFFIKPSDLDEYLEKYSPMQLRDKISVKINKNYNAMNFGEAKGLSFDRTVIYPTKPMLEWIINHSTDLAAQSRSKFYVAITRARYSVAIVFDNKKNIEVEGIKIYQKDDEGAK
ncbi:MAG: UvrD-helicase domain-containing protein [Lachnospiraceae bacterium]|nr:UvrD-helicase domain-containing protein [Lachnospiraceae bacterium]